MITCEKGRHAYALVLKLLSTWGGARLTMAGHMAEQGGRWSAIGLKWMENGQWPAVIFISDSVSRNYHCHNLTTMTAIVFHLVAAPV